MPEEMEVNSEKLGEPIEKLFQDEEMSNEKAQELIDSSDEDQSDYDEDSEGQMEIAGSGTVIEEKIKEFIACLESLNRAKQNAVESKQEVLDHMDAIGKTSIVYQGKKYTKVEGSVKNPTLRISN